MSEVTEKTLTITLKRYSELLDKEDFLYCLEAVGVDNWDGFNDALKMHEYEGDSE